MEHYKRDIVILTIAGIYECYLANLLVIDLNNEKDFFNGEKFVFHLLENKNPPPSVVLNNSYSSGSRKIYAFQGEEWLAKIINFINRNSTHEDGVFQLKHSLLTNDKRKEAFWHYEFPVYFINKEPITI